MVSGINGRATTVTPHWLRRRLAETRLPSDPLAVSLPPGSERWPGSLRRRLQTDLKPAGVLIPVIERQDVLTVLLTQRAAQLKAHASQVSFPGGRMEEHDDDVCITALRETREEVGIDPAHVAVIGYLESMPTITGYAVTPVIGLISPDFELTIDRTEVEYAFEVPLEYLLDARNDVPVEREFEGRRVTMMELHYEGERIWGATAMMIEAFRKKLLLE